jgi:hypothetical protein
VLVYSTLHYCIATFSVKSKKSLILELQFQIPFLNSREVLRDRLENLRYSAYVH